MKHVYIMYDKRCDMVEVWNALSDMLEDYVIDYTTTESGFRIEETKATEACNICFYNYNEPHKDMLTGSAMILLPSYFPTSNKVARGLREEKLYHFYETLTDLIESELMIKKEYTYLDLVKAGFEIDVRNENSIFALEKGVEVFIIGKYKGRIIEFSQFFTMNSINNAKQTADIIQLTVDRFVDSLGKEGKECVLR